MRNLRLAALAFTCLTAPLALAQKWTDGVYEEVGLTRVTVSNGNRELFQTSALRGVVGYLLNQNVAFEGVLGIGVVDGTSVSGNVVVNQKIDSMYGLYGKAKTALSPGFEAFARAGYFKLNASSTYADTGSSYSGAVDGFSWGVGATYVLSPIAALSIDCTSYYNKDGLAVTGPSVGLMFKF